MASSKTKIKIYFCNFAISLHVFFAPRFFFFPASLFILNNLCDLYLLTYNVWGFCQWKFEIFKVGYELKMTLGDEIIYFWIFLLEQRMGWMVMKPLWNKDLNQSFFNLAVCMNYCWYTKRINNSKTCINTGISGWRRNRQFVYWPQFINFMISINGIWTAVTFGVRHFSLNTWHLSFEIWD